MSLTPCKGVKVSAPYIEQSPIAIECRVKEIIHLGTHDMFIADVLNVIADDRFINPETGAFDMKKANLLVYAHGGYYSMGELIGTFGWTVKKKK
jgi:flavin reductase (DIM6/NTAB) family NADH-FMN oxidoreductase RutF